jgi:ABC-2 type transport system permease protein
LIRIFDIAAKDILQLARDRKIFLFLLIMPVVFTFLFGYAFGAFSRDPSDSRLPVGFQNQDEGWVSDNLVDLLAKSQVFRLEMGLGQNQAELESLVADEKLAGAIIIPPGYGQNILHEKPAKLILISDTGLPAGQSVESEALSAAVRLDSAIRTAIVLEEVVGEQIPFDYAFEQALESWDNPPIQVKERTSSAIIEQDEGNMSLAHVAPGMMLQFAIAGLLTSAQIIVTERKSRSLERILTTATPRLIVLLGHFLAIFLVIMGQFIALISFGQLILNINYSNAPEATALVALASALCISALGLLIGMLAKSEEQAIALSIVPMFVLSGLGGAWVPLEFTGETFRIIGHASPIAWAMDGFKNISIRGLGLESVLIPAAVLLGYAVLFFSLATWRMMRTEER